MSRRPLKTSTAMILALSLAQPLPALAQDLPETIPPEGICADGATPPCAEGVELILPEAAPAGEPAAEEALTEEPAPAEDAVPADEAVTEEAAPAEKTAPAEDAVTGESAPSEGTAASGEGAPAEETATEDAAPAEEVAPPDETVTQEAAPAEETATEKAVPADEAVTEEAAPAEDTATEEVAPAEDTATEEAAPAEEAVTEEAAPAEEAIPEEGTAAEEIAPGKVTATGETAPGEEAAPTGEAGVEATAEGSATVDAEPGVAVVEPDAEARKEEAQQVLELLGTAEEADGKAAAAEAETEAAPAEATETVITEADTRQSTEDFATSASGAARADAGDRDGLSDLEKAALIGLGILVVGTLLRNGDEVVANTGDRVVVRQGENDYYVLKDDDTLLRQPGSTVRTETFNDGSTRTTFLREDGTRVITIRDASGRVLRRVHEDLNGRQTVLIDDTVTYEPVEVATLPEPRSREVAFEGSDPLAFRIALERASAANVGRSFSLRQIREIERVRKLVPEIALDNVTFETGSAAIQPSEAGELVRLGDLMRALIEDNPSEVFMIEGHTDAVGSAASNLALSDRRAESVALALTEYFDVPPENMVVQGYGESDLKIDTDGDERENRRVAIRRITSLLDERIARN